MIGELASSSSAVLKSTHNMPPVKLVLCTASYPFGHGEQFLETELPYLARAFDHIVVVPAAVRGTARPVPRHVVVDTSLATTKLRRSSAVFQAMRAAASSSVCRGELWANRLLIARKPHVIRRLLAFYLRAEQFRRWLRNNFQESDDVAAVPVVYSYWLSPPTLGAGLARAQIPGLRVMSRAHRHDLYEEVHSPTYLPFRHATLSRVDAVYSVSSHGADYLRRRFPGYRERIHVARLGVNDPRFACPPSADGIFRVVSCSFVIPVKRVDLIVRALKELGARSSRRRIHWVHIGAGPVLPEIRMLADSVLPENVSHRFMGHMTNEDVIGLYRENPVDVFVHVSASEGVPVSIMEAQSCGIPVVATAAGGTAEIVNDENGRLLPVDVAPGDVAAALHNFFDLSHGQLRRLRSRQTWCELSNAERIYPEFAKGIQIAAVPRQRRNNRSAMP